MRTPHSVREEGLCRATILKTFERVPTACWPRVGARHGRSAADARYQRRCNAAWSTAPSDQQLLDGAQVGAVAQRVRGVGVARVRRGAFGQVQSNPQFRRRFWIIRGDRRPPRAPRNSCMVGSSAKGQASRYCRMASGNCSGTAPAAPCCPYRGWSARRDPAHGSRRRCSAPAPRNPQATAVEQHQDCASRRSIQRSPGRRVLSSARLSKALNRSVTSEMVSAWAQRLAAWDADRRTAHFPCSPDARSSGSKTAQPTTHGRSKPATCRLRSRS